MVDLARKNLLHDKLRFFITVLGVAFAVMLVLFQVGLFLGLLDNASVIIEHLDADLWVTPRNTANVDFSKTFPETRVDRVRSLPGVARADNLIVAYLDVSLPTGSQEGALTYALEDFEKWGLPWSWSGGTLSDLRRGDYVMIDGSAERRFGHFEVGEYREFLGRRLKIIGRTAGALTFTTMPVSFMDLRLVQELVPDRYEGQSTYILVKLAKGADVEAVKREIQARLPYNDVHTKREWARRSRAYWVASTGLGFTMGMTV
ncbi:MAG: ABC transporter permease, partial [Candidatus Eisenbacteria bacterium]